VEPSRFTLRAAMADTAAKLGEALGDDLRMGEICLRALA
jgi:hypothetical protein